MVTVAARLDETPVRQVAVVDLWKFLPPTAKVKLSAPWTLPSSCMVMLSLGVIRPDGNCNSGSGSGHSCGHLRGPPQLDLAILLTKEGQHSPVLAVVGRRGFLTQFRKAIYSRH